MAIGTARVPSTPVSSASTARLPRGTGERSSARASGGHDHEQPEPEEHHELEEHPRDAPER